MTDEDPPQRGPAKSAADSTLLGVAPPRIDSSADSPQRSPVLVRAGTSSADIEPEVLSRVAIPSRAPQATAAATAAPPAQIQDSGLRSKFENARRFVGARPVIGMLLFPVVCALCLIAIARHPGPHTPSATTPRTPAEPTAAATGIAPNARGANTAPTQNLAPATAPTLDTAELERRPQATLTARELVTLAEAHDQQKRAAAAALREKLERNPASAKDPATMSQLLTLSADPVTAPQSLSALAELGAPGADALYEVWTSTPQRTDSTELARALLYSPDVRPKASAALSVALDLRAAESCEQYQAALPKALQDGDRRSLHVLTKLNVKRGCGAKKNEDCYACLREKKDELTATINAAKSRRPPGVAAAQ